VTNRAWTPIHTGHRKESQRATAFFWAIKNLRSSCCPFFCRLRACLPRGPNQVRYETRRHPDWPLMGRHRMMAPPLCGCGVQRRFAFKPRPTPVPAPSCPARFECSTASRVSGPLRKEPKVTNPTIPSPLRPKTLVLHGQQKRILEASCSGRFKSVVKGKTDVSAIMPFPSACHCSPCRHGTRPQGSRKHAPAHGGSKVANKPRRSGLEPNPSHHQ